MTRSPFRFLVLAFPLVLAACSQTPSPPNAQGTDVQMADAQDTLPDGAVLSAQSGVKLSDATARGRVGAAGISVVSSGGCSNRSRSNCTSLEQVNSGTIDNILTLRRASGCAITITGGTETGHSSGTYSHWNGYKLDISKNSCINGYVTRNFTRIGNRGDGAPRYQSAAGNIYADEYWANHWDILYY